MKTRSNSCRLLPVSPVEFRVDGSWVNSCPVVVLGEELFIDAVLQTVWNATLKKKKVNK